MGDHLLAARCEADGRKIIASVLAPGGELYFADAHPTFNVLEEYAGRLVPTFDFQTPADRPLQFVNETTYTGDPTIMTHQSTQEWIHSLSAVLGGLMDAGLAITMFHEHEVLPWRGLASLVPASERMWRLPDGVPRIPCRIRYERKKDRENEAVRRGELFQRRVGMPAEHRKHHEEANNVGDRNRPAVIHSLTDLPSGYILVSATPADEPNQIIEPPKPTAYAR